MSKEQNQLKLTIELVPKTSWCNNVRKVVSKKVWDNIRRKSYSDSNNRCAICNATGKLSCHEIWDYDDISHNQSLRGFIALCTSCHMIKHIGMAGVLAREGKLDLENLIRHFILVNNCDEKTFENHMNESFEIWNKRSLQDWSINFGEYEKFISKNKSGSDGSKK